MPQDFYEDAAAPPAAAKEPAQPKEDSSDSQVAELPLAVFGPNKPKVGDKCTFEVTQVAEDSAVVRYAQEEKEESEPTSQDQSPPQSSGGGSPMSSLMQ